MREGHAWPSRAHQHPRLEAYIAFCEDWNERNRTDPGNAPQVSEFHRYADMIGPGLWWVEDREGRILRVEDAPVFFEGGEVSWRTEENGRGC